LDIANLTLVCNAAEVGTEMYQLIAELYSFCRSITGDGVRKTLRHLQNHIPLTIQEVPTGSQVFDWVVPKEWNIRDGYIKNARGEKIVDFRKSNLHVAGYSIPVRRKIALAELKEHLFTLPTSPDWVPYRAFFYKENWGFCLSHNQLQKLTDDEYEVCIDATLDDGSLTYGEYYLKGKIPDEVLISVHVCHPSLCNDNLSGVALATFLAKFLSRLSHRHSYRFLFIPSTIGSITWLARNESHVSHIRHGLVVACVGDSGRITYKKTRRGDTEIDRAVEYVLKHSSQDYEIMDFVPYGYDERQFCSPGFNLPVGCFMRTPYSRFPEYHTSADNLDFVHPQYLADSLSKCIAVLQVVEHNRVYVNQNPKCEPQLGKRGLYRGYPSGGIDDLAMLWVLNLSDGTHTLLDIAERANISFDTVKRAADALLMCSLLRETPKEGQEKEGEK
jgi:aminopeptidase-like protein